MRKPLFFLIETRAGILSTSILPVILGSVMAFHSTAIFRPDVFGLLLASFALMHLGTNVINDYFDFKGGTDNINADFIGPFSGGSRLIQDGKLLPKEVFAEGAVLFAGAFLFLFAAAEMSNMTVLLLGSLGALSGIFYSAPPLKISRTGFGEVLVVFVFGPLIALASYCAQSGHLSPAPVLVSMPLGLLTSAFVVLAEIPDYEADRATGKNNIVVRFGKGSGQWLFTGLHAAAFSTVFICIRACLLDIKAYPVFFAIPVSAAACILLWGRYTGHKTVAAAAVLTLIIHLAVSLLLIFSF